MRLTPAELAAIRDTARVPAGRTAPAAAAIMACSAADRRIVPGLPVCRSAMLRAGVLMIGSRMGDPNGSTEEPPAATIGRLRDVALLVVIGGKIGTAEHESLLDRAKPKQA